MENSECPPRTLIGWMKSDWPISAGELAGMSDALARSYETCRMACGLRADGTSRMATMQRFWAVWEECRRQLEKMNSTQGSELASRSFGN